MISRKVFLLAGISILLGFLSFYLINFNLVEEKRMGIDLEVGSPAGFNLDSDAIHFGRVLPGDAAQRSILLKNDFSFPVKIKLEVEGELEKFVFFEDKILLKPNEETQVNFAVNIPEDQSFGNYSGELVLKTYRTL